MLSNHIGQNEKYISLPDSEEDKVGGAQAQQESNIREEILKLLDASEDKNFIFLYGAPAAGKTAVLGSVIQAMERPEISGSIFVQGAGNGYFKHGLQLWKQIQDAFQEKRFPGRTVVGSTIQLHVQYKPASNATPVDFVFLEMAGEDLKKVVITDQGDRKLPFHIDLFLRLQIKIAFLIVTSWDCASEDDDIVNEFLSYIHETAPGLIENRIILLVSKWDSMKNSSSASIDEFIRSKMPKTYDKIANKRNIIQSYSIGKVIELPNGKGDMIAWFDYRAGRSLFSSIYETFTEISSEQKNPL